MNISKTAILRAFLSVRNYTDKAKLAEHQHYALHKLLSGHNSRFYPHSIDLNDYPVISKRLFMQHFADINTAGVSEAEALAVALKAEESRDFSPVLHTAAGDLTVGLSSGTSGSRGIFLVSPQESALWAGYTLRRLLPRPWLKRRRIAFFLRANSNLYTSVRSILIDFRFYDLMTPLSGHIAALNRQRPDILIAPAQVLGLLAVSGSLNIRPEKIISVAEVLEDDTRAAVEARFQIPVAQVYQCTEGFLAHTCSHGSLHLNEDMVYIEKDWLDKDSGRFCPIVTDFNRRTQPVIRYRLDDVLVWDGTPCLCGSVFGRLKKIEGRCDDILNAETVGGEPYALYPDFVRRALITAAVPPHDYRIVQQGGLLNVQLNPNTPEIRRAIENALAEMCRGHGIKPFQVAFQAYTEQPLHTKLRRISRAS